jgi:hypothetical protein
MRRENAPLRIGVTIILSGIVAENRGGWHESQQQSFRRIE